MPIHTYKCPWCTNEFDKKVAFDNIPEFINCPTCQSPSYRVLQVPNVHYRGSGFSKTDIKKPYDPFDKKSLDEGMEKTVK